MDESLKDQSNYPVWRKYVEGAKSRAIEEPLVTFDDIKGELPYDEHFGVVNCYNMHVGQRKLFLSEVQFLTNYSVDIERPVCVYAGAAPSAKHGFLSYLFPKIRWVLVDPNPFDIKPHEKVNAPKFLYKPDPKNFGKLPYDKVVSLLSAPLYSADGNTFIINDYFTDNIAKALKAVFGANILFISDIRTNINRFNNSPADSDIIWNSAQQYNWIKLMNPRFSVLKFRHPFYTGDQSTFIKQCEQEPFRTDIAIAKENGIDFIANYIKKEFFYLQGIIYLQAWAGASSAETRLVITNNEVIQNYGTLAKYENTLNYFNSVERSYIMHRNVNANRATGFDHCNDCALENVIWSNYINLWDKLQIVRNKIESVPILVAKLERYIYNRGLIRENHGKFYEFRDFDAVLTDIAGCSKKFNSSKHKVYKHHKQ